MRDDTPHICANQNRIAEICPAQSCAAEIGIVQGGLCQTGEGEICRAESCAAQVGFAEVCANQIGLIEDCFKNAPV